MTTPDHPEAGRRTARPDELEPRQRIWYATAFTQETGTVTAVHPAGADQVQCVELRSDVGPTTIDLYLRTDACVRLAESGERGENAGRKAIAATSGTASSTAAATRKPGGR